MSTNELAPGEKGKGAINVGLNTHEGEGYLVDGYIREQYIAEYNDQTYPVAINTIIIKFLGSIFLRFDQISKHYQHVVKEDGKLILSDTYTAFLVGCSLGLNTGIKEIRVKCITAREDAIGIISKLPDVEEQAFSAKQLFSKLPGYKYWWYNKNQIRAQNNQTNLKTYNATKYAYHWKNDDVICIRLDFDKGNIGFYINDELKGNLIDIEPNLTCYLFMVIQWKHAQYRLLS